MRNLDLEFGNFFRRGPYIADKYFRRFTEHNLIALDNQNTGGKYDVLIVATGSLFSGFYGEIDNELITKALSKSKTSTTDQVIALVKREHRIDSQIISGVFPDNTDEHIEFYPNGITEYGKINKTTFVPIMNRLNESVKKYASSFIPAFVSKIAGYLTAYNTARGIQLDVMDEKENFIVSTDVVRLKLEVQLVKNLHILAAEYVEDPEKGRSFFKPSLLAHPRKHRGDEILSEVTITIPANTQVDSGMPFTEKSLFSVINDSEVAEIGVFRSQAAANQPLPAYTIHIIADEIRDFTAPEAGPTGNMFLRIANLHATLEAVVTIAILKPKK